ncbi:MAG TPA: LacI family DNA-binding transcriptional regulator [Anaerolineaceae bacterium]|nr:LacI family DNA-binding transcriptional regulator [Anaerolineaceae bacterium]
MRKQKPSISDVAEAAGVSIATVSHVINDTRYVSEEVTEKVKRAIAELGYMPSALARGLAGKETKIIGAVFSDIANPFFTSLYSGLESVLTAEGYEVILANTGELDSNQELTLRTMLSRQIDGLVIAPTGRKSKMLAHLIELGIPVVLIDRSAPVKNASLVDIDNVLLAYQATAHLIQDGYERIGIIMGLPDVSTTKTRLEGYQKALQEFHLPFREEYLVFGQSSIEGGYRGVKQLFALPEPPKAIFTLNNLMTSGALHAFRELGIHCPQDVGLIGFDDHDWGDILTPPLTVVRQPTFEMGLRAAKALIASLKGTPPVHERLEGNLIVRGSCSAKCQARYFENMPAVYQSQKRL